MTVSTSDNIKRHSGNGSTTGFAFTFPVTKEEDLYVEEINNTTGVVTAKTLTTHYTVSGTGNDTGSTNYQSGTVTMGTAPASGVTLIVKYGMDFQQGTDYIANDTFAAETHEQALDELTMQNNELREQVDASLKFNSAITGVDTTIKNGTTITADQYLKLNSAGDGFEFQTLSSSAGLGNVVEDTSPQLGGDLDTNGNNITVNTSDVITFEGSTADAFETTLTVVDPTADRTWSIPDATDTAVGKATTDTLTNKTLTTPVIASISNSGTITVPTGTDTLVARDTTDTLTNKTLTSPVLNTGVSGTAVLDEDDMSSDSATQLATQQSIKAYVDAQALGKVVQVVTGTTTTETSTTTTMIFDDTIPQNTEGHEIMTLAITPTNSSNKLIIEYSGFFSHSTAAFCGHALFQDSTADALAATSQACDAGTRLYEGRVRHVMTAGTGSSTTFKVRGGGNTGTFYSLQNGSSAMFGGVNYGIMTIYEIEV